MNAYKPGRRPIGMARQTDTMLAGLCSFRLACRGPGLAGDTPNAAFAGVPVHGGGGGGGAAPRDVLSGSPPAGALQEGEGAHAGRPEYNYAQLMAAC